MRNDSGPLPILVASSGILVLTVMDGVIKSLAPSYPTAVIVLMRFVFGGLVATAIYLAMGAPRIERQALRMAALRAVFIVASAWLFFAALGLLPLVEVIALSFVSPIAIALFGRLFLGEAIERGAVLGIALGTVGLAVMLGQQWTGFRGDSRSLLGVSFVLLSTVTYAISLIILRARATRDPLPVLVLLQNWIPALFVLPLAALAWTAPAIGDVPRFAAIGVLGAAGHVLLTWAFARANAARLGVVEYTALAWGALIGYVGFGEVPSATALAGAALIVAGAVAVSRRSRQAAETPAS